VIDIRIIFEDKHYVGCIKPSGVLSESVGMPELLSERLNGQIPYCVHRLDKEVAGVMVYAKTKEGAAAFSKLVSERKVKKEYLAVVHGVPAEKQGTLRDLLLRSKPERKTYVVTEPGKDVQEAILKYWLLSSTDSMAKLRIELLTGRTHQIRAQFSSRSLPLVGDRKYSLFEDDCEIALWSHKIAFNHPYTGKRMEFIQEPPSVYPWTEV